MAANKRPSGDDFEPSNIPLKQPLLEPKPKPPSSPSTTLTKPPGLPPPKQVTKPAFIGILPSTTPAPLDYSTTTPSGIFPLASPGHPLRVATPHSTTAQISLSTLTSLAQRFPSANLIRPLITLPSSSQVVGPQGIPDAPPPPYPLTESLSDEFGCSSPSQFLHSPTTVQTCVASFDELKDVKTKTEHQNTTSDNIKKLRKKLLDKRRVQMSETKALYERLLQERFFLEGGGNMMDYQVWKKKPNILKEQYMKQHDLESETPAFDDLLSPRYPTQSGEKMDTENILEQESPLDFDTVHKHGNTTTQKTDTPIIPDQLNLLSVTNASVGTPGSVATSPSRSLSLSSPRPIARSHSTLSVSEISHEDIVMRARHEAEVMKAISELRKEGVWSCSRLPKVLEPQRIKTHWDYLLEEMQWLSTDFANERRWKMNAAKKVSKMRKDQ